MLASDGTGAVRDDFFMMLGSSGCKRCTYALMASFVVTRHDAWLATQAKPPETEATTPTLTALSQKWMTPELIAETQAVWSPCEGRMLTVAEAVEILGNVKQYVEVMLRIEDEINAEKKGLA